MQDLLTTKQVIGLLKIDRTTVYRMLKNGRLSAIKVGSQWRFPRQNVEALIAGNITSPVIKNSEKTEMMPLFCIQLIQDVLADIAKVGSITTDNEGKPLTEISNSCEFCNLILASPSGKEACISSWRALASQTAEQPQFFTCHAGFQYARGAIRKDGKLLAMLIAGQFYADEPDPKTVENKISELAEKHNINPKKLAAAVQKISVLDERWRQQIAEWLQKTASALENVTIERAEFLQRLKSITELSSIGDVQYFIRETE